jgi:hypothetical protein
VRFHHGSQEAIDETDGRIRFTAVLGAGLGNLLRYAPLPFRFSMLAVVIWIALVLLGARPRRRRRRDPRSRHTVREAIVYL